MSIVYHLPVASRPLRPIYSPSLMSYLIPLRHYRPLLDMNATEQGIKVIKEFFAAEVVVDAQTAQHKQRSRDTTTSAAKNAL